jgi:diaminopimelate epimerase
MLTGSMLCFTKMNGAGNDFVMIDNRAGDVKLSAEQIVRICDRHRGVGADGILLIEPAQNGADFRMRYYNRDGGEAEMCGNGARCFARFARRMANVGDEMSFETRAGVIGARLEGDQVRLTMSEPRDPRMGLEISATGKLWTAHFINSGVPHVVVPVKDIAEVDVNGAGAMIRHDEMFAPAGTNVNFLEKRGANQIAIRTYERGVESETLACGTGVVASALIFAATEKMNGPIRVLVKDGSELSVGFERDGERFTKVTLTGPAEFVFDGTMEI